MGYTFEILLLVRRHCCLSLAEAPDSSCGSLPDSSSMSLSLYTGSAGLMVGIKYNGDKIV